MLGTPNSRRAPRLGAALTVLALAASACATGTGGEVSPELTVYSGRGEELVGPILQEFQEATGITVKVRYGDSAELAALLLEESDRSPADLFFAQDAGALGAIAKEGLFTELNPAILELVPEAFRDPGGRWVGLSGRVRVVVYNTERIDESELPDSILGFTDPRFNNRIGWAPQNASFQAFVTASRKLRGEEDTRRWLEEVKSNGAISYPKNTPIVEATATGEIDVGFVNHYYLLRLKAENPGLKAENYFLRDDVGGLVNVAGAGILRTARDSDSAERLLRFLLSEQGQRYFVEETFEYPLVEGVDGPDSAPPLQDLDPVDIDLSDLDDLEGTLNLLREVGLL